MADGELFDKLESMVDSGDLTLKQGVRLLMSANVEIYRKLEQHKAETITLIEEQKKETTARLDEHHRRIEAQETITPGIESNAEKIDQNSGRIGVLESGDKKSISKWGAIGIALGAGITGIINLVIELIKNQ